MVAPCLLGLEGITAGEMLKNKQRRLIQSDRPPLFVLLGYS